MQLDRRSAELLFQVLTERGAISNRHQLQRAVLRLDEDIHRPATCAAIVDRLTFAGQIIETGTVSYRLTQARRRRPARADSH